MSGGLDVKSIRTLEDKAKSLGLDERTLIENASSNLYQSLDNLSLGKRVAVIAGRGNNGADVLSCARKLVSRGYDVRVIITAQKELGVEAGVQLNILERIMVPIQILNHGNFDDISRTVNMSDFVLEGILGIGIKGEVTPFLKDVIHIVNSSNKKVISCDIPSGLSPDEGKVLGAAIKADYTITFIAPKRGFFLNEGPNLCGKVIVVDIGISKDALSKVND
ncbi:MAG: NAD(P)H-hydrate epimerase [Candidatus Omnitrophota bacterium]|nr:NAD(P)H-hydrate epimerase [Candidatus Omnitrophota bacterium]